MILGSPHAMPGRSHHAHYPRPSVVLAKLRLVSLLSECGTKPAVLDFVCLLPVGPEVGKPPLVPAEGTAALCLVTDQPHSLGLPALTVAV